MKAMSLEGLVCYIIRAEAVKVQGKYFPILAWVKMPFIKKYANKWVLEAIDHDIIQHFDGNNMA